MSADRERPDAVPDSWERIPSAAFGTHVGPFYRPADGNKYLAGFVADERHGNKRGVVHGGMLATAFDVCLGNACWDAAGEQPAATIQLNIQYVGALQIGEFATIRAEIVRATRSLIFVRGTMAVSDRMVATGEGIWKVLTWRGAPYVPPPLSGG